MTCITTQPEDDPETIAIDTRQFETDLRSSGAMFEAIVNSVDQMIWSTLPDGFHDYYNARWYEFTGMPEGSTDGPGWNAMFHEDDQERAWKRWQHSLETGEPYYIEYRLRHRSGEYRWVIGKARPLRDTSGQIVRWFGTCTDVHDLKMAEEQLEIIAKELSHRIKNIFTLIMSLVTLSARMAPESAGFANTLRSRIEALAHAHQFIRPSDVRVEASADSHTIEGLISALLAAYREEDRSHIFVIGGEAEIGPRAATTLALVIHELATNAIKYGALSNDAGRVVVECVEEGDKLVLVWTETGGPPVAGEPAHKGFGTFMAQRAAAAQLDADIERRWLPGGLVARLTIPVGKLRA